MKVKNFARFYVLLKENPCADKEMLVREYTSGRTSSLREMTRDEYDEMCDALEGVSRHRYRDTLRRMRSSVLLRIARLGISTVDNWDGIDAFCRSPRIAGKEFRYLNVDELSTLLRKLEGIIAKGGLNADKNTTSENVPSDNVANCVSVFYIKSRYLS